MRTSTRTNRLNKGGSVPALAVDVLASAEASVWLPSWALLVWDASGCTAAAPLVDGVSGGTSEERREDHTEQNCDDSFKQTQVLTSVSFYPDQVSCFFSVQTQIYSFSAFTWHSRKPNYLVSPTMMGSLSDQIGFLIVELKHPDYWLIVTLLLHVYVPSDQIGFCILHRCKIFSK